MLSYNRKNTTIRVLTFCVKSRACIGTEGIGNEGELRIHNIHVRVQRVVRTAVPESNVSREAWCGTGAEDSRNDGDVQRCAVLCQTLGCVPELCIRERRRRLRRRYSNADRDRSGYAMVKALGVPLGGGGARS